MHYPLLAQPGALPPQDMWADAQQLGLAVARFNTALLHHAGAARVAHAVGCADLGGGSGTPIFFLNGRRLHGAYDIETLSNAVRLARARAAITP